MTSVLAYLVTIGVLVVFHELGHYWVARLCDVKVLRFSVGFGNVVYSRRFGKGETEWAISAIPLGGYVKMLDEREGEVAAHELPRAFNRKPVLQRIAIVVAGPVANLLLAVLLYAALFMHGVLDLKPELGAIPAQTPAAAAGLKPGEVLLRIDGDEVKGWMDMQGTLLNLVLKHEVVPIEGRSADGTLLHHELDMRSLVPADLDGDYMKKLGLHLAVPAVLGNILEGAAQRAGLRSGDAVQRVNGQPVADWEELVQQVSSHPGEPLQLDIVRNGKPMSIVVTPERIEEGGKTIGRINAANSVETLLITIRYTPLQSMHKALRTTANLALLSLKLMGRMVTGELSLKNITGPITVAQKAGESAHAGLGAFVGFLAFISVSLGVMNLLPIPILDGGHLMYYIAEFFKGGPVSERAWEIGQMIGVAMLAALMSIALYNEISRLIAGYS